MKSRSKLRRMLQIAAFTVGAAAVMAQAAEKRPLSDEPEKRGYWWKMEPPPETAAEEEKHPILGPPPSEQQLSEMHPQEIEKLIGDYREYALWKMTPEHVAWYYELQDFARRRSRAFMNTTQLVMLQNPQLNMNTVYPTSPPGQKARVQQRESSIYQRLQQERANAALVMLSRKGCPYCVPQRAALKFFQQRHGWEVRELDLDEHQELIERFGTNSTPTTVVIFRGTDEWMPVSVGVDSVPAIEENLYRALRMMRGETTSEQFGLQDYQDGGMLDPRKGAGR